MPGRDWNEEVAASHSVSINIMSVSKISKNVVKKHDYLP